MEITDWLTNTSPPWAAYRAALQAGKLVALDKCRLEFDQSASEKAGCDLCQSVPFMLQGEKHNYHVVVWTNFVLDLSLALLKVEGRIQP
jgi:hypothetical protein